VACSSSVDRESNDGSKDSTSDAGSQPPTEQEVALARVNAWREQAGFAPLVGNEKLHKAADNHAKFVATNPRSCAPGLHDEVESCAGYTGASPGDRMHTVGYNWSTYLEAMNGGEGSPEAAVDGWLWTVYHRLVLFWPDITEGGFSCQNDICVLDVARPSGTSAPSVSEPIVFPTPDMSDVPRGWDGSTELPTPPAPSHGWPSGPVVSLHFPQVWTIETATLARSDALDTHLPIQLLTPETDSNLPNISTADAFLYAESPLDGNTSYTVRVEGTVNSTAWSKTWSFTTTGS
jgi:hypothetical protein